jgi:hypothetical protein
MSEMKDLKTRLAFADFLERLGTGKTNPGDWFEYVINHYQDEYVEEIRASCARLAVEGEGLPPRTDDHRRQLKEWAEELRASARA